MGWEKFGEYGLNGLIMGAVILLLFFVIKWTLATTKDIMAQSAKEREGWVKALSEHTAQAKSFHDEVKEAHFYQRQEHQKMAEQNNEICKALGRINGFKDDRK